MVVAGQLQSQLSSSRARWDWWGRWSHQSHLSHLSQKPRWMVQTCRTLFDL